MRTSKEVGLAETPRWRLWIVALVAFGPVMATWLLGVLYSLFWANILVLWVTEPERLPVPASDEIWGVVTPIALVASGFIGLVGLLRVLTLPCGERPRSHRFFTIAMVAVGLTGLAIFDLPLLSDAATGFSDGVPAVAMALYVVFPFAGGAWILAKSWKLLVADRSGSSE